MRGATSNTELRPDAQWNALVQDQRSLNGEQAMRRVGAYLGATLANARGFDMDWNREVSPFIRAIQPPLTDEGAKQFQYGVQDAWMVQQGMVRLMVQQDISRGTRRY